MGVPIFYNNISFKIEQEVSPSDTVIKVADTFGIPTPTNDDYIIGTFLAAGGQGDMEIVHITAVNNTDNELTIVRAQENTSAQSFLFGSILALQVTAGALNQLGDSGDYVTKVDLADGTDPAKGANMVGYSDTQTVKEALDSRVVIVECVHDLVGFTGQDGDVIQTQAYWPGWAVTIEGTPVGGAIFNWVSTKDKSEHNGGNIVSPTVPWDGTEANFAAFVAGTGETDPTGKGCWVHVASLGEYNILQWGAKNDNTANGANDVAVQNAFDYLDQPISGAGGSTILFPRGDYVFNTKIYVRDRQCVRGEGSEGTILFFNSGINDHCLWLGPTSANNNRGAGQYVFGARLENLSISGKDNYQGFDKSIVYTDGAHEHSGLFNCNIRNYVSIAIYYNTGNGGPAHFQVKDCEMYTSNTQPTVGTKKCIVSSAGGSIVDVSNTTITGGSAGNLTAGILMTKDCLLANGVHFEHCDVGISLAQSDGTISRPNTLTNITGNATVTQLVVIASNFSGGASCRGLQNVSSGTSGLIILKNNLTAEQYKDGTLTSYNWPRSIGEAISTGRINVSGGTATLINNQGVPVTVSHAGTGIISVSYNSGVTTNADFVVMCTARPSGGGAMFCEFTPQSSTGFNLTTRNQAGTATDAASVWFALYK